MTCKLKIHSLAIVRLLWRALTSLDDKKLYCICGGGGTLRCAGASGGESSSSGADSSVDTLLFIRFSLTR